MALYQTVPHEVEAIQITKDNAEKIAEFMVGVEGFIRVEPSADGIILDADHGQVTAPFGAYIVKYTDKDAYVYDERNFKLVYNRVA